MKIAFIGLGNMGVPMALNLVAAGFEVIGYDPIADAPEGIEMASSAQDAAFDADAVITMLPNGEILRAVAAQIRSVTTRGALHLDCSTVDVESARAEANWQRSRECSPSTRRFQAGYAAQPMAR